MLFIGFRVAKKHWIHFVCLQVNIFKEPLQTEKQLFTY